MDAEQHATVASPVVKVVTAWAAVGITSWSDAAAALAAIYTMLLIAEWLWKKLFRPFAESRGWINRKVWTVGDPKDPE